jgi:hypothetical protein
MASISEGCNPTLLQKIIDSRQQRDKNGVCIFASNFSALCGRSRFKTRSDAIIEFLKKCNSVVAVARLAYTKEILYKQLHESIEDDNSLILKDPDDDLLPLKDVKIYRPIIESMLSPDELAKLINSKDVKEFMDNLVSNDEISRKLQDELTSKLHFGPSITEEETKKNEDASREHCAKEGYSEEAYKDVVGKFKMIRGTVRESHTIADLAYYGIHAYSSQKSYCRILNLQGKSLSFYCKVDGLFMDNMQGEEKTEEVVLEVKNRVATFKNPIEDYEFDQISTCSFLSEKDVVLAQTFNGDTHLSRYNKDRLKKHFNSLFYSPQFGLSAGKIMSIVERSDKLLRELTDTQTIEYTKIHVLLGNLLFGSSQKDE